MRVLYCLDGTNSEQLSQAVALVARTSPLTSGLLYVTDTEPRREINYGDRPILGPKSVGHVARFVLDHAPCPVFLARPLAREQFPLPR